MISKSSASVLRAKYGFQNDVLEVIIRGKSAIDTTYGFEVADLTQAQEFIESYGYDLSNPVESAEILGNYHEALNFIRKTFLKPENPDGLGIQIPRKIIELTDVRELFLMASMTLPGQTNDKPGLQLSQWACSLLKVMHTISHIDRDVRTAYFSDIQKQILDRIYKLVHRDTKGKLFLADGPKDPTKVELVKLETKPKKSRDSITLKLLHKPENVADEIFDRVGIRLVTATRLDAVRCIKYLRDRMIVMPANIKPSRSRNSLVPMTSFREKLKHLLPLAETEEISEEQLVSELEKTLSQPQDSSPDNPHSSGSYRSIQFTCRQLIKLSNPNYQDLKELKGIVKTDATQVSTEVAQLIDRLDLKNVQREVRFFYPFEVQIMDQESAEENQSGKSSHSKYKRSQITAALKRVMGSLADGLESDSKSSSQSQKESSSKKDES